MKSAPPQDNMFDYLPMDFEVQFVFRLSPSAASISSITYSGVGRKWCSANTSDSDDSVFSPPDRLAMFFQLFLGGRTLKMMPCSASLLLSEHGHFDKNPEHKPPPLSSGRLSRQTDASAQGP
jgi:hypothetical protein